MSDMQERPLRALANSLRLDRHGLTDRWMKAVFNDVELDDADRLTNEQLADHVPVMVDEICMALDEQDLDGVEPAIERAARQHGRMRWRQGYRIDELVRELELLRQVLTGAIVQFAVSQAMFTRRHEVRAQNIVDDAIGFVTLTSIREVVTERDRKIDEYTGRLERANGELLLKQRLVGELYESRMQITRSVVHDLRNFLNVFSTALQLMRSPARVDAAVSLAGRQVKDMAALVDELVEYSVLLGDTSAPELEEFPLRDLFDELVAAIRPALDAKGLRLVDAFDGRLERIVSNRLKLKQIALNLLTNAAKYTKAGEVGIAMQADGDGRWRLRVSDTGVGIGASDRERVFREFERAADADIPGAGLGLAIVRELCRVLRGEIRFESEEGAGTTFEIAFPLRLESSEASER